MATLEDAMWQTEIFTDDECLQLNDIIVRDIARLLLGLSYSQADSLSAAIEDATSVTTAMTVEKLERLIAEAKSTPKQ
ncbi:MAG: hypothetical protein OXI96_09885 [Acidimicrobiaceae bacterium]|nr:hypothetical protein [Acidimicrobiaceae bacterium]